MSDIGAVAVVGGGVAGLTVALELARSGHEVALFEKSSRIGGVIRSENIDGYLIESGPNSIQPPPVIVETIHSLGLQEEVLQANSIQRNRYIVRNGQLHPVPLSPGAFLRSKLFTARGKTRLLAEPLVPRGTAGESVADFVRRRVGPEFLDYAIDPFVAGVYAGDPEKLSMSHAFPRMVDLEHQHGSLIKGMFAQRLRKKSGISRKPLISFVRGMESLPLAMARELGARVRTKAEVVRLQPEKARWILEASDGKRQHFIAVVSCVPINQFNALLPDADVQLPAVTYPPVTVVGLGYRRTDIAHPLDGFGVLVPSAESKYQILGALFSSSLFPDRAPGDQVLLTVFLGGVRHGNASYLGSREAASVAHQDLRSLLSITGQPAFEHSVYWDHAIPQYDLRYRQVTTALRNTEERLPGLFFAGNYRGGISVVDTIQSAREVAGRVSAYLQEKSHLSTAL